MLLYLGFVFYIVELKEAPLGHGGMPEGSQDKRIRKPESEKRKGREIEKERKKKKTNSISS